MNLFSKVKDESENPVMPTQPRAEDLARMEDEFYSAFTKNTFIEGNISTKDDMLFSGGLRGNVNSTKIVHLAGGLVEGQVNGGELKIEEGKIRGDVSSKGPITLDNRSMVIGDVRAHDIDCDGKVKGDLYIEGSAVLKANAVIFGNIRAADINIDQGAMVKGSIEVVRQIVSASKLFDFEEEFMDLSDFATTTVE